MSITTPSTPRWQGGRGRLEVWYLTCAEPDGTGWWFHYETVAPTDPAAEPFGHGWVAVFPPDGPPVVDRFGPAAARPAERAEPAERADHLGGVAGCRFEHGCLRGATNHGRIAWDLAVASTEPPLFTFPRWVWEREALPGADVVDRPDMTVAGRIRVDGVERTCTAVGARAHIYGRGNAARWAWLHADLPGGAGVCEVVAAVPHLPARLPGGVSIPPRPFARLRFEGRDLPRDPLLAAIAGRASATLPRRHASVRLEAGSRLDVVVDLDPAACVQLEYPNPDGSSVWCVNTERASARVAVERRRGRRWETETEWDLDRTAHAEVGRPTPWPAVPTLPFRPGP